MGNFLRAKSTSKPLKTSLLIDGNKTIEGEPNELTINPIDEQNLPKISTIIEIEVQDDNTIVEVIKDDLKLAHVEKLESNNETESQKLLIVDVSKEIIRENLSTRQEIPIEDIKSISITSIVSNRIEDQNDINERDIRLCLVPHQHSFFCERKQRICAAVGKLQELEFLTVEGAPSEEEDPNFSFQWVRIGDNNQYSPCSIIDNSSNLLTYQLSSLDVGHWIGILSDDHQLLSSIGPIIPGPPRLTDFEITGSMEVGGIASLQYCYLGGKEGDSQIWWLRVDEQGKRTQVTNPASDDAAHYYSIRREDVGCRLKAKCRPVRSDGMPGEIFTSKSSTVIIE